MSRTARRDGELHANALEPSGTDRTFNPRGLFMRVLLATYNVPRSISAGAPAAYSAEAPGGGARGLTLPSEATQRS